MTYQDKTLEIKSISCPVERICGIWKFTFQPDHSHAIYFIW